MNVRTPGRKDEKTKVREKCNLEQNEMKGKNRD